MVGLESSSFTSSRIWTFLSFCSTGGGFGSWCLSVGRRRHGTVWNERANSVQRTLFFHSLALISGTVGRKKLNIVPSARNITGGMVVAQMWKVCDALTKFCSVDPLRVVIQPYPRFNPAIIQFQALLQPSDAFELQKQEETFFGEGWPLQRSGGVNGTERNRSREVNESILFMSCSMLKGLCGVTSSNWW